MENAVPISEKVSEVSSMMEGITGFNDVIMGPAGTGKTYSVGTLVETGLDVFYLSMESGLESLLGYFKDKGKPIPENLHWHKVAPAKASFDEMISAAEKINTMSLDVLAKAVDMNKSKYNQFILMLKALNNFHCDRTNQDFGAVNTWGVDRVLVIDGLTGICGAAMSLVIGGKAVRNQSDWGIAQDQVEKLLRMLCDNCNCHFVLIAHVEREVDQVLGGVKLMASSLGQKLSPKIPSMFSDVLLAVREGNNYYWDTLSAQADVKTRNLTYGSKLTPDFKSIYNTWKKRTLA